MESPSSTVRRTAWIQSSRQWLTLEDPSDLPSTSQAFIADDDVFADGCCTGKIENWLLHCGLEACSENYSHLTAANNSFEDDLSLGADASVLNVGEFMPEESLPLLLPPPAKSRNSSGVQTSTPHQKLSLPSLNLGHSMASSFLSSSTSKTTSSVSEVLQMCAEDPEETLYQLGFGCDEPRVTARIPTRFFTFNSQLRGINFRLFLQSQLQRIRDEDPSLSLASRFRQVEVLTAMANAFYSLYSHVSRTPLQKLAPPEFTFSPTEKIGRFRSSVRSDPRSPVERLKDTVSKMCLYTGSPRGSDSTSPQPSPRKRSSLPDVVGIVLETAKTTGQGAAKKLDLGESNGINTTVDIGQVVDSDKTCSRAQEMQRQLPEANISTFQHSDAVCHTETAFRKQPDISEADENGVEPTGLESGRSASLKTSQSSSLSGQTVTRTDQWCVLSQSQTELDLGLMSTLVCDESPRPADSDPVTKVAYDVISPRIVESVQQTAYSCQEKMDSAEPPISSQIDISVDATCSGGQLGSETPEVLTSTSKAEEDCCSSLPRQAGHLDSATSLPHLDPKSRQCLCHITVTGWESDNVTSCSSNTLHSIHSCSTPGANPPVQISEQSPAHGKRQYLSPLKHQTLEHISSNLRQANSFELEEVYSAGEDDIGQSEMTRATTLLLATRRECKGLVVRGDSVQSDSSGYADEDISPPSDSLGS